MQTAEGAQALRPAIADRETGVRFCVLHERERISSLTRSQNITDGECFGWYPNPIVILA